MKLLRKLVLSSYIIWVLVILFVTPFVWLLYSTCALYELIRYIPNITREYLWSSPFDALSYQHYKEQREMDRKEREGENNS